MTSFSLPTSATMAVEGVLEEIPFGIEKGGGNDDMAGSGGEPMAGIFRTDSPADLHAARPCGKGFAGGGFIA